MASDQLRRENVTEEHDTMVEKDRVPKMATHYEHLSEKAKEEEQHISPRSHEKAHRQPEPSLEEISKLRATAQQNSVEAIRAAGEKAVAAKDVAAESGKGAAGYVGKVKDQAVVAGWGATQYTLEKVAEATKAVAGAGKTVVGYAEEKIAAAKDVVVANEEKAADFAARKKAEAQKASHHENDKGSIIVLYLCRSSTVGLTRETGEKQLLAKSNQRSSLKEEKNSNRVAASSKQSAKL
ncbi:hypothetical protein DH2020_046266 [Rehmannia glutinosa]|uniref:Uncharacterized protein n=1 Tax=Rehmannia glutinosa TaxID=99300 RepID=A0ABR0UBR2_REHGL